jgi:hypothetical protein
MNTPSDEPVFGVMRSGYDRRKLANGTGASETGAGPMTDGR